MKKKDLSNLKANELRQQIAKAQMEISTKRMKNTNAAKNLKKLLAKVLTMEKLITLKK